MKYTEILNRRLKKAGREYRTGNHSDKKERLWNAIQEIMEEAEGTGSFLPWTEAVQKLKLNEQQQMLIPVGRVQKTLDTDLRRRAGKYEGSSGLVLF